MWRRSCQRTSSRPAARTALDFAVQVVQLVGAHTPDTGDFAGDQVLGHGSSSGVPGGPAADPVTIVAADRRSRMGRLPDEPVFHREQHGGRTEGGGADGTGGVGDAPHRAAALRTASTARATSSSSVAQLLTEIRSTSCPRQREPDIQVCPSAISRSITARVRSSSSNPTHTCV